MKKLFINIISGWPIKKRFFLTGGIGLLLFPFYAFGFQTEKLMPSKTDGSGLSPMSRLEAGLVQDGMDPPFLVYLSKGKYPEALGSLRTKDMHSFPWVQSYLEDLIPIAKKFIEVEGEHFVVRVAEGQEFLADYALPSLERTADYLEKTFDHRPNGKIIVEIYANKEDFSKASTLDMDTLKRSGAIGICKFHRLMITSPQALPLGYRWLDALSHEYLHLVVNEITHAKSELWLQEGTARYFETAFRAEPPLFLSPVQKTDLLNAFEENRLISFDRMSPSLVYLKDQDEVSLAFAEVSYAISIIMEKYGPKKFFKFLTSLRDTPYPEAFKKVFRKTPSEFEMEWQGYLGEEKWEKTIGALSDEVRFTDYKESEVIGASAQGKIRLGDRMRMRGRLDGALLQYESALEIEPDNAIILLKIAKTYIEGENPGAAIPYLKRAIDKNPNYITPYVELAPYLEAPEAVRILNEAVAINPFDPRIYAYLSKAYHVLGDMKAARRNREILNQLVPN